MRSQESTLGKRFAKVDKQFDQLAKAVVKGFAQTNKQIENAEDRLRGQIDIYTRAVDSYAKTAETYMQEMLALGSKVDRHDRQIQEIAEHLNLKLSH